MKFNFTMSQRLFAITGVLMLATTLPVKAQQVVFNDVFTNGSTVGYPSTPGGTPTASSTSYDIATPKGVTSLSAIGCVITNGQFNLAMLGTSSAYIEGSAVFTMNPVTLAIPGDCIDIQNIFTATTNYFSVANFGGSATLALGLYNSRGSIPYTNLYNNGLTAVVTPQTIGGVQNWVGYRCNLAYGNGIASANSATVTRPVQNQGNNLNQALLNGFAGGVNLGQNGQIIAPLTIGSQYTEEFKITMQPNGSLTMTNLLYAGVGTSGTVLATNFAAASGANILTTNFDAFCIGGNRTGNTANPTTNFINQIIITFTSSNQAGPYFNITSSGDPCAGGLTLGLNGSVTTNVYLLYTNGVNSGQSVLGTGSAISFGLQTFPAIYTVIASNTATASMGPMYGNAIISAPGVTFTSQPASVTVVTNVLASFSATVNGTALTYQWYKNAVALTNSGTISGAQTPNLVIYPTGAGDVATTVNGYYLVAKNPCGVSATSAPNASLTLTPPRNLVWAGGNPDNNWEYTESNFTLSGNPTTFKDGDIVTFDNTSGNTTVTIATNVVPTKIIVSSTSDYTFNGSAKLTGFGTFVNVGPGNVIIDNSATSAFDYTGGTLVTNGATMTIGDGSTVNGAISGIITVSSNSFLNFNTSGAGTLNSPVNVANGLAGNGTANYADVNGSILATPVSLISSNFNGVINISSSTALHASDNNAGYAVGNGSTVNVPANNQIWLDRSLTSYNSTFNIAGTGWPFVAAGTPRTGALRIFNCIVNGPVNLLANARIGGTINGATIQSVISGAFQLEVYGNTNSYVLVLGPTNGAPQAYSSTLITAGAIRAINTNAISSGPLVVGEGGDMQVNGFNVTVANLSSTLSASGGLVIPIEGPRVRNMNTTNAGTLTVGTDGTGTEFDGTFSDGSTAAFGLTKVGGGILTLTGVSTNTGIVTVLGGKIAMSGSGSFGKASQIVVGSGATYDVSAAGGTLTLNTNQALKGVGTVAGNLSASLGSTVAPGLPMGTLTVSGSATVNGTYRPNLNRTNVVNCSIFTASGGVTFSGATLSVTNVGPILQAGDFFQLFPGATAGFTSAQLQVNDVPNNAVYTWNNTVGSDGKITVATVTQLVNTAPTNIVTRVNSSNLELSWPTDHTGWTLQSQTNSASVGISTNWVNVSGSALVHSVTNAINKANAAVFYRLVYP